MKGIKKLNKQQGRQAVEAVEFNPKQFFNPLTFSSLSMACTHLIYLKSVLTKCRQKAPIPVIILNQMTQSHP